MYRMGKNAIETGSRDHWTIHPKRIDAVRAAMRASARVAAAAAAARRSALYNDVLRDPAMRDPRGFILPSDQPDFLTATKFVNIADQGRRRRAPRHGAVHRRRQAVSGRLVRRQDGAGVPRRT